MATFKVKTISHLFISHFCHCIEQKYEAFKKSLQIILTMNTAILSLHQKFGVIIFIPFTLQCNLAFPFFFFLPLGLSLVVKVKDHGEQY